MNAIRENNIITNIIKYNTYTRSKRNFEIRWLQSMKTIMIQLSKAETDATDFQYFIFQNHNMYYNTVRFPEEVIIGGLRVVLPQV